MKEVYIAIVIVILIFGTLIYTTEKDKRERTAARNATCSKMCPADKAACYQYFMEQSE